MGEQKRRRELSECAKDLLLPNLDSSEAEMQSLIDDGYFHLSELKRSCNTILLNSLAHRVERAEYLRDQIRRQAEEVLR